MYTVEHDDAGEEKQHAAAVLDLAGSTGMDADEVRRVYELVLARYRRQASIRDYLPILVSKRVRDLIRTRQRRRRQACGADGAVPAPQDGPTARLSA